MNKRLLVVNAVVAAVLGLASVEVLAGEKAIVFTPEAVNVNPAVAQAVAATLATELESRGYAVVIHREAVRVVEEQYVGEPASPPAQPVPAELPAAEVEPVPPPPEAPVPETPDPAKEPLSKEETESKIAGDLGAAYYFTGVLVRLGKQMQFSLEMHETEGGLVAAEKMGANTEDDLPMVITRITDALLQKTTVEETRDLDNATRAETQDMPQRFRLEKNFGAMLGHAFGLGDMGDFTQITFDGRFEFDDIIAEIDAGMGVGNSGVDEMQFIFDIAMSYYLIHSPVSPYIGAGFGVFLGNRMEADCSSDGDWVEDSVSCDDTPNIGWNLFPAVGLEFLRHSAIRLHADFRYLFNFSGEAFGHAPMVLAGINF